MEDFQSRSAVSPSEKRTEDRQLLEMPLLPFLGSREEDYQPFQYVILDISQNGVRIAIPSWVRSREKLYRGDRINLHLPYKFKGQSRNQGSVAWQAWDSDADAQICGVALDRSFPETYPVFISLDTQKLVISLESFESKADLLHFVLKDLGFLKRGMLIYLDHLSAYFARVFEYSSADYKLFRNLVIKDMKARMQKDYDHLSALYSRTISAHRENRDALELLDFEELRESVESTIYIDLFSSVLSTETINLFLVSLKTLEKKSYNNYNTLVMLYLHTL